MRDHIASKHQSIASYVILFKKSPGTDLPVGQLSFHGSHIAGVYLGTVPSQGLERRCLEQ